MKYIHPFDIWQVPVDLLSFVQPGQWVYAGDKSNKGRFFGVKKNGVVVVAWYGNAVKSGDVRKYYSLVRQYAKGVTS